MSKRLLTRAIQDPTCAWIETYGLSEKARLCSPNSKIDKETGFIDSLIMSHEAHFHLDGFINKQNSRIWTTESPKVKHQRKLYPFKFTVWCGITTCEIIGPFFEDDYGNAVTVKEERYRTMLKDFAIQPIQNKSEMWFQQEGATCYIAKQTIKLLSQIFGNRIISKGSAYG